MNTFDVITLMPEVKSKCTLIQLGESEIMALQLLLVILKLAALDQQNTAGADPLLIPTFLLSSFLYYDFLLLWLIFFFIIMLLVDVSKQLTCSLGSGKPIPYAGHSASIS